MKTHDANLDGERGPVKKRAPDKTYERASGNDCESCGLIRGPSRRIDAPSQTRRTNHSLARHTFGNGPTAANYAVDVPSRRPWVSASSGQARDEGHSGARKAILRSIQVNTRTLIDAAELTCAPALRLPFDFFPVRSVPHGRLRTPGKRRLPEERRAKTAPDSRRDSSGNRAANWLFGSGLLAPGRP